MTGKGNKLKQPLAVLALILPLAACFGGQKRQRAGGGQNLNLAQAGQSLVLFTDSLSSGFTVDTYDSGRGLITAQVVGASEAEHGSVLAVDKSGEGLANVFIRSEQGPLDLSALATGALELDLKVKRIGAGGLRIKLDSGYPQVSDVTVTSVTLGSWQRISIPMASLISAENSLEPGKRAQIKSIVHPIVVEPVSGEPFALEIDNVVINHASSEAVVERIGTPILGSSVAANPSLFDKVERDYLMPTELWGELAGAKQTNRWWSNLVLASPENVEESVPGGKLFAWGRRSNAATPAADKGKEPIFPLPYAVKSLTQGIYLSHKRQPRLDATYPKNPTLINDFLRNFSVEVKEPVLARKLLHGNELSAAMRWSHASGSMTIPFVMGSPYMTAELEQATPVFATQNAIINTDELAKAAPSTKILVKTNHDDMTWIIYSSVPMRLEYSKRKVMVGKIEEEEHVLTAAAAMSGVVRVVMLPSPAAEALLDKHVGIYPVSGKVETSVQGDQADIVFKYETKTFAAHSGLLMLSLPHHRDILQSPSAQGEALFNSIKGPLVGVVGDTWLMREELTTLQFVNRAIPESKKAAIRQALLVDKEEFQYKMFWGKRTHRSIVEDNPYFFGKYVSGMGQLALVADELGEEAIAHEIREQIKKDMQPWLDGVNKNKLVYDKAWGGLVSKVSLEGKTAGSSYAVDGNLDFGNGVYNDHHFHYGYFLHAAAVVGKKDPAFVQANRERLFEMVRDIANPLKDDPYYPFARVKDWYHGHSWAGGITPLGDGKNQESTSESVHAYYGLYLLAHVLGDQELADFGRLLLATEIRSAQKYWQLSSANALYDDAAPYTDRKVTGILFESKASHAIWWDGDVIGVHMIQYMPYTAISEQLLGAAYMQEAYPVAAAGLESPAAKNPDHAAFGYVGYIYMAHAILDKEAAWNEVPLIGKYDDGNTKTNTLYWMATRP